MDKEPSKAAIEKANALVRSVTPENVLSSAKINPAQNYVEDAFARFLDHVSEVAKELVNCSDVWPRLDQYQDKQLRDLILPDPEPDVLAEAWLAAWPNQPRAFALRHTEKLATELAKRGGRIVFDGAPQP